MDVPEDELLDLIAQEALVDRATLKRDASLADLGIQSIDLISVIFEVENRYGLTIDENDLPPDGTLGGVLDVLRARLAAQAPGNA